MFRNVKNNSKSTFSEEIILKNYGFELLKKIGQGSYAKVYLGLLSKPEPSSSETASKLKVTKLVCKIIDTKRASPDYVAKFLPRELDILLKLNHPFVIHTHSLFKKRSKYFIFMRYAERGDLLDFICKNGPITETQARIWTRQIASGIQYLQTLEIGHRDLKCENILITANYNVKITDFGFARFLLNDKMESTLSSTFCGSLQYAAPEIIKYSPYNPKASDIWAFGVILYVMLNKSMPFNDASPRILYKNQIMKKWRFRSKVVDKLTAECKGLVEKMLEPDVAKRCTVEQILSSDWISMDERLKIPTSDELIALTNAKEHIQALRKEKTSNNVRAQENPLKLQNPLEIQSTQISKVVNC